MALSAAQLLKGAKKKATVTAAKPAKKDEMRQVQVPDALKDKFVRLCELGFTANALSGVIETQKDEFGWEVIEQVWAKEMWEARKKPDNFRVISFKANAPASAAPDCIATFVVEFRKDSIKKKIPAPDSIPDDSTLEEVMIKILKGVGLSEEKAKKFVQDEIVVGESTSQKPYEVLLAGKEDSVEHSAGMKLLQYMQARPKNGTTVKVEAFTDEEMAAVLVTTQTVTLKEGLANRIFTYCDTFEQLMKLLRWINVTDKLFNFTVGEADPRGDNEERMAATTKKFLYPSA